MSPRGKISLGLVLYSKDSVISLLPTKNLQLGNFTKMIAINSVNLALDSVAII